MNKLLTGNQIYANPPTEKHEESMRYSPMRFATQEEHEREMFNDAARRVVFYSCFEHCGISHQQVKNLNSTWYYNMDKERSCQEKCTNAKMLLHFGNERAEKEDLYMNGGEMKKEYQGYEAWNPNNNLYRNYEKGWEEDRVQNITNRLLEKTRRANIQY